MYVLVVPSWYPSPRDPFDGDYVKDQANLLSQAGLEIRVCTADLSISNLFSGDLRFKSTVDTNKHDVSTHRLSGPFPPKNIGLFLECWQRVFTRFVDKSINKFGLPDVIHAHTFLGASVAKRIGHSYNIPVVYTEHYSGFLDGSLRHSHKKIAVSAIQNCEAVTAVSERLGQVMEGLSDRKVQVVPNFIDTRLFVNLDYQPSENQIVFLGDLIPRKNVHLLLKATAILKKRGVQIFSKIIGDGPLKARLMDLSESLDIVDETQFLGRLNKEELIQHLKTSKCLVLTSFFETFGLVVAESLSCGVPVVAFKNGGSDNLFGEDHGIHVDQQDAESLADAIHTLIVNHNRYQPQILRKHVIDNYSPEVIIPRLSNIYSQVISQKGNESERMST